MFRALAGLVVLSFLSSAAVAQVMYLPVRSQFTDANGQMYYYGGNDPRVHAMMRDGCPRYGYGTQLHRFDGGNSFGQPAPFYDRTPVFTDCIPFQDAAHFGYTAADAHNEAAANAARYFRKSDQLAGGIPTFDGALLVPPTNPQVYVVPGPVNRYGATQPSTMPQRGDVIIIPKNLLDRKLKDFDKEPQKVAIAK
jgi:hypothetical protein